ncbi:MAG: sugar ABC transporter permease [Chloroflexota bacterium]
MSENKVKREATEQQRTIGNVIAVLFAVLGVALVGVFLFNVFTNPNISDASSTNATILNFLDGYGIIIPLLVFGLGFTFLSYARGLLARDIITSGWAQLTMFWSMVGSIVIIFIYLFQVITTINSESSSRVEPDFLLITGLIVFGAITGVIWWWLTQNREVVYNSGEETIASRESLTAWNLLIPTVVILILVAARPLERTFIGSLTDRTFAGGDQEVNFIGLQNYTELLGFRFDNISCTTDDSGECATQVVEEEVDASESITVDLNSIPELEPTALDVGLDFFEPDVINMLIAENADFANALATVAQAEIEESTGEEIGEITVNSLIEGNTLEVTVDGETQEIAFTERLTNLEGVDLSGVDYNYGEHVSLNGLNTYRIRSRTLREQLEAITITEYDFENDETIDDVGVDGFADFETMNVTVTRIETRNEVVYPNVRDAVGESYRNYSRVSTFDIFGSRWVFSARDAAFFVAVGNTLFFTFFAVIAELILGMIIALVVNAKFVGQGLMRAAMLVPWAIPTVVSAKLWEYMLIDNRTGLINDLLIRLNFIDSPIAWLANSDFQIWSLIFVDVWKTTPFMALLLLAGLQTIPSDVYEAADVDGAGPIRQFFYMTLPLLRPTIAVALVFRTLDSIRAFDVFQVLLGRQLQSMATYNQFVLVEQQDFGYASAIGVTIFMIILIFTVVYVRALGVDTD